MQKTIKVNIDHFGLMNRTNENEEIFFRLGFTAEGGRKNPVLNERGEHPADAYFVFDNAYFGCTHSTVPDERLIIKYEKDGLSDLEFYSGNVHETNASMEEHNVPAIPVGYYSRYADHGKLKGAALFVCTSPIAPLSIGLPYGAVENRTRDLFYDNSRYVHDNQTHRLEEIILFCDSEEACNQTEQQIKVLQPDPTPATPSAGIQKLTLLWADEARNQFGLIFPEINKHTAGIRILSTNPALICERARKAGFNVSQKGDDMIIDLLAQANLFLIINEH